MQEGNKWRAKDMSRSMARIESARLELNQNCLLWDFHCHHSANGQYVELHLIHDPMAFGLLKLACILVKKNLVLNVASQHISQLLIGLHKMSSAQKNRSLMGSVCS